MSRHRLLLVNHEYPPLGGGAATATEALARAFAEQGADVHVLTAAFPGLPREEISGAIRVKRVRALRRRAEQSNPIEMITFMISAAWQGMRLARDWKPDLSIAFFGIPAGPVSLTLRNVTRVPYIVSLRGGDVPGHQPEQLKTYHALAKPFVRHVWKRAAAVVANSSGLRDQALRALPDLEIPVIHNGVDTDFFSPGDAQGEAPDRPVRLLFVGRVSYEKGLQHLLPALANMADAGWMLRIVGDGPYMDAVDRHVRDLGLEDRVERIGWITREQLPSIYRDADLFVFPSTDEGMPNSVLEAMASGLPVIATRIPGSEDLVVDGETGALVEAGNTAALADALSSFIADGEKRRRMGAAGRQRALDTFSWQKTAEAYLDLANRLLVK